MRILVVLIVFLLVFSVFRISNIIPHEPEISSSFISLSIVYAQGNETNQTQPALAEHEMTIDRQLYKPAKITLNYPYTHSHDVRNITTIGSSLYRHESTPYSFTFIAEDVDVYTFTVELRYDNSSRRSILIAVWEGDRPMQGETWTETGQQFVLNFRISLTEQPKYPSGEEVASLTFHKFEMLYVQQLDENRRILADVQASSFTNSMLMVVFGVTSIISLLLAGFGFRRRRMMPGEG